MVDFSLSEEQLLLQKTTRDFARKEIEPAVTEVENADRIEHTSLALCRDIHKKAAELGFTTLIIPEKYGGAGMGCMEIALIAEELGAVDMGVASSLFETITIPQLIISGGNEEQRQKWLVELCNSDLFVLACGMSEADSAGSEVFCPYPDPKLGLKTYAKREGNEYVINGSKSAFITNAGIANSYFIIARTDLTKPPIESTSIFYIPADVPGLTIGKTTEMIGLRTSPKAEVFLDDVRVPKENLIGKEGDALTIFSTAMPLLSLGITGCYVGLARAAYEYALDYAKQRQSWGQPIIKHQAVALLLADMEIDVQASRLMTWQAAYATDNQPGIESSLKVMAAKVFAVDVAMKTAQNAVKILGAYGVSTEFKTSKYLCDAWMGHSRSTTGDMIRLEMVSFL